VQIRPFQENKSPKNGQFSEEKASGLGGFNFWNYLMGEVRAGVFILPERTPLCPWWLGQEAGHNLWGNFSNPDLLFSCGIV
jgi:hypothetical protein